MFTLWKKKKEKKYIAVSGVTGLERQDGHRYFGLRYTMCLLRQLLPMGRDTTRPVTPGPAGRTSHAVFGVNTAASAVGASLWLGAARHAAALAPHFMACESTITFTPHVISVALLPVVLHRYDLELI